MKTLPRMQCHQMISMMCSKPLFKNLSVLIKHNKQQTRKTTNNKQQREQLTKRFGRFVAPSAIQRIHNNSIFLKHPN
jgi:hypothetical protein